MISRKERTKFPLIRFRWLFLVDSIVIVASVMSFGIVAAYRLDLDIKTAPLMICMIPPMVIAMCVSTFVIVTSIRKRMGALLDAIQVAGNGSLDVRLETKGADETESGFPL